MVVDARRPRPSRMIVLALMTAAVLALGACSPEDGREFGAGRGSGADPGNYDTGFDLHGDEDRDERIYHETPQELPAQ